MEFHEALQSLRKRRGLTQEELAEKLYVSRTAISKWESGRGYPSIDSLKAISKFFSVTIDELLSGEEILTLAEEDRRQQKARQRDLVFGLLDCGMALLLFLPLFGENADGVIRSVSLLALTGLQPWLKLAYMAAVAGMAALGILTLALQTSTCPGWVRYKTGLSLTGSSAGVFLFILSRQPYPAALTLAFLLIKAYFLQKQP